MPKLQKAKNGQYRLTISPEIIKLKGWTKGQELTLIAQINGDIAIKEI